MDITINYLNSNISVKIRKLNYDMNEELKESIKLKAGIFCVLISIILILEV